MSAFTQESFPSTITHALATTVAKEAVMFAVRTFCWFQEIHAEMAASQYPVNLVIIACVQEITMEGFVMVWSVQCRSSLKTCSKNPEN